MSDSPKIISPWGKGSMRALREISKANILQEVTKTSEISNEISDQTTKTPDLLDDKFTQPTHSEPTSEVANKITKETTLNISHKISKERDNDTSNKPSNDTINKTSNKISKETASELSNKPSSNTSYEPSPKTINKTTNKTASELSGEPSHELLKKRYVLLDSTHTSAEQKIYSVMYRETISKGINGRRFPVAELMELTGINSNTTVIRALRGLTEKYSIAVASRDGSRRFGVLYKIHTPSEITNLRNEKNILIEHRRKEIISGEKGLWNELSDKTTDETSSSSSSSFERQSAGYAKNKHPDMQKINNSVVHIIIDKNKEKFGDNDTSSLSQKENDDEKLSKVQELFEQLSNGGTWKNERDFISFEQIKQVNLWHIVMGLCYSVVRSPEHKFNSLAYAIPAILEHEKQMKIFSEQDMLPIAYKTMRQTINCMQSGKWSIPDWLAGDSPISSTE